MRERRLMFAPTMFALVMAGTFAQSMPTARGDECITKPNAAAPQGQHWYYRIDHSNNRQCWRLGPEGIPVLKNASRAEKTPASEAIPQSALPPQVQTPVTTTSAIASADSAFDSNVAETTGSVRWPEAPILPELPRSPQPMPQPIPAEFDSNGQYDRLRATRGKPCPGEQSCRGAATARSHATFTRGTEERRRSRSHLRVAYDHVCGARRCRPDFPLCRTAASARGQQFPGSALGARGGLERAYSPHSLASSAGSRDWNPRRPSASESV